MMNLILVAWSAITAYKLLEKKQYKPMGKVNGTFVAFAAGKNMVATGHIEKTDSEYDIYRRSDIIDLMLSYNNPILYEKERYDCEQFAIDFYAFAERAMKGCTIGIAHAVTPEGGHAVNFFIDEFQQDWIIDIKMKNSFKKPDDWVITFKYI